MSVDRQELSHNASGFSRYETYLRWVSTWSSAIGWSITEAGVAAVAEFAGDEFISELARRYRLHRKQKQQKHSGYGIPCWAEIVKALSYVEAGVPACRPETRTGPTSATTRCYASPRWI